METIFVRFVYFGEIKCILVPSPLHGWLQFPRIEAGQRIGTLSEREKMLNSSKKTKFFQTRWPDGRCVNVLTLCQYINTSSARSCIWLERFAILSCKCVTGYIYWHLVTKRERVKIIHWSFSLSQTNYFSLYNQKLYFFNKTI